MQAYGFSALSAPICERRGNKERLGRGKKASWVFLCAKSCASLQTYAFLLVSVAPSLSNSKLSSSRLSSSLLEFQTSRRRTTNMLRMVVLSTLSVALHAHRSKHVKCSRARVELRVEGAMQNAINSFRQFTKNILVPYGIGRMSREVKLLQALTVHIHRNTCVVLICYE